MIYLPNRVIDDIIALFIGFLLIIFASGSSPASYTMVKVFPYSYCIAFFSKDLI